MELLAALGLLACLALLLRMALPPAQQRRWDAFWQGLWHRLQAMGPALQARWQALRRPRAARREAQQAIERAKERARSDVQRDGNVIRPDRFKQADRKKPPLH